MLSYGGARPQWVNHTACMIHIVVRYFTLIGYLFISIIVFHSLTINYSMSYPTSSHYWDEDLDILNNQIRYHRPSDILPAIALCTFQRDDCHRKWNYLENKMKYLLQNMWRILHCAALQISCKHRFTLQLRKVKNNMLVNVCYMTINFACYMPDAI